MARREWSPVREWVRLTFSKQIVRRRLLGVRAVVLGVAVVGIVLFTGYLEERTSDTGWFNVPLIAEYDLVSGTVHAREARHDEWWAAVRAWSDTTEPPRAVFLAQGGSYGFYERGIAMLMPFNPADTRVPESAIPLAVAALQAEYERSTAWQRHPELVQAAASAKIEIKRFQPYPAALIVTRKIALYIAAPVVAIAILLPRRREFAAYRTAAGVCTRCRYPVRGLRETQCPECGTVQPQAAPPL